MIRFSEYVSLGYPDKVADYISQYLLDRYIEQDPMTRYAVEVQIKGYDVTLGGEVSSKVNFGEEQIAVFVRQAVREIGYTKAYQRLWGEENAICGEDLSVTVNISQQSPDIAQGLTGWGDQGIFFGMATSDRDTCAMPYDHAIAKRLCKVLFESGVGGLDIKTQVVTEDNAVKKVIVAIPLLHEAKIDTVKGIVWATIDGDYELIVNGTGRYVQHSTIADCGTTGRKLAVDFYGGNCLIGGGCVDGDTEYLSPNGWRKMKDYDGGMVAQVDDGFNVQFVFPKQFIETFSTDVYDISLGNTLNMVLSGNHNVYYRTSKKNYTKKALSELLKSNETSKLGHHAEIPRFFNYSFDNYDNERNDTFTRFIIAHCADGTILKNSGIYNARIRVKKKHKVAALRSMLSSLELQYEERAYSDGYAYFYYNLNNPSNKLSDHFGMDNISQHTALVIADEIFKWDGSIKDKCFRTTIKEDADLIQFILSATTGKVFSLLTREKNEENYFTLYTVREVKHKFSSPFRKVGKSRITKLDPQKVYCFTVSTGLLLLRRNNYIFVTGNSPWTKDGSKADLTLNLLARRLAKKYAVKHGCDTFVRLACCIGRQEVDMCVQDAAGNVIEEDVLVADPAKLRRKFRLDTPIYASMCRWGLFGEYQQDKVWEG